MQATIQDSLTSDVSDVSATIVVSFSEGGRSPFATGGNAGTERSDVYAALFGPGGPENILLNMEVQELRRMNLTTRRMSQEE